LGLRPVRLERCQATVRAFLLEGSFFIYNKLTKKEE